MASFHLFRLSSSLFAKHTPFSLKLITMATRTPAYVIGIDFGTTFSGISFLEWKAGGASAFAINITSEVSERALFHQAMTH